MSTITPADIQSLQNILQYTEDDFNNPTFYNNSDLINKILTIDIPNIEMREEDIRERLDTAKFASPADRDAFIHSFTDVECWVNMALDIATKANAISENNHSNPFISYQDGWDKTDFAISLAELQSASQEASSLKPSI